MIGLIERPLALSMIAGYATGLWDIALPLGITLELLWLDVVAMGSIIQPFSGMAFLLLFPICAKLMWTQPGIMLLPLVLSMIAAHIGSLCELRYRISRNSLLELVTPSANEQSDATPENLCLYCIIGRAIWHGLLYLVCYAGICLIVSFLLMADLYPPLASLDWPFVFAMATIGAVLSLRERTAYLICFCVLAAVVIFLVACEFWG